MNRRTFLHACVSSAGLLGLGLCTLGSSKKALQKQAVTLPNVIIILADDMGYGDIGAYNPSSKIPTPNLDQLSKKGMRFTDAHSGSAVCTPTRYGIITGRYCWRSRLKKGVLDGYSPHLIESNRLTIADIMKQSGYLTACIGKWHLGMDLPFDKTRKGKTLDVSKPIKNGPRQLGFDYFYGVTASLDMPPYVFIENNSIPVKLTESTSKHGFPEYMRSGATAPGFDHRGALDHLTIKATDYIKEQSKKDNPFFLYFPLTAPHKPCMPHERFQGKTKLGTYGDFVSQVDWVISQIDLTLKQNDILDNTLVIYSSDNGSYMYRISPEKSDHIKKRNVSGYHVDNHQANAIYRGTKADIWEGGHRIPFLVRWPKKVAPGTICDKTICLTDLMATCADITDNKLPANSAEDSFSIYPLILGNNWPTQRAPVIHHSFSGVFSIRQENWKMVFANGSGGRQKPVGKPFEKPYSLFDMEKDPSESHNIINKHPKLAKQLTQKIMQIINSGRSR